jgi:hypothetical protein
MRRAGSFIIGCMCIAMCSCGGKSVVEAPAHSSIAVSVTEFPGGGLAGFEISLSPYSRLSVTDSTGSVVFTDLPVGKYTIGISKAGYTPMYEIVTLGDIEASIEFSYVRYVELSMTLDSIYPYSGIEITSVPPGISGTTDMNGRLTADHVPMCEYTLVAHPEGLSEFIFGRVSPQPEISLNVESSPPVSQILSPLNGQKFAVGRNLLLQGSGSDPEEGPLPDSSFVWSSDIDGILGKGSILAVSTLSPGKHVITLRVTDSTGKTSIATISIQSGEFQLDSFFPMPAGETWNYRYLVPEFYLTRDDGKTEYWSINSLDVSVSPIGVRKVMMVYIITRDGKHYQMSYTLCDYYQLQGGVYGIVRTTEDSEESQGSESQTVFINTTYSPPYPGIGCETDLTHGQTSTFTIGASVTWYYISNGLISNTYYQDEFIPVTITVGDQTDITLPVGTFSTRVISIVEKNIEKKWWLGQGIGLVKFEDNSFSPKATAVLQNASLLRFQPASKTAGRTVPSESAPGPVPSFHIDRSTPEGMRDLHRLLSGMCPR